MIESGVGVIIGVGEGWVREGSVVLVVEGKRRSLRRK